MSRRTMRQKRRRPSTSPLPVFQTQNRARLMRDWESRLEEMGLGEIQPKKIICTRGKLLKHVRRPH